MLLGVAGFPAGAADWTVSSDLSQRIEADTNRGLNANKSEPAVVFLTTVGLNVTAVTKRSEASVGVSAQVVAGAGAGAGENANRINPGLSTSFKHEGKRVSLGFESSLRLQPVSTTQVDDTGQTDIDATQISVKYVGDLTMQLSNRSQLMLGANASWIDFTENTAALVPTQTFGVSANLRHELTQNSTLSFKTGVRSIFFDDATDTRSQTLDLSLGLDHQRTRRHTFGLNGGVTFVRHPYGYNFYNWSAVEKIEEVNGSVYVFVDAVLALIFNPESLGPDEKK